MVMITVRDFAMGADSVDEGRLVADALNNAIAADDVVTVSFAGIGSASSSFVSAALIPLVRRLGVFEFKRRVKIVGATWQIADVIKRRIALEDLALREIAMVS